MGCYHAIAQSLSEGPMAATDAAVAEIEYKKTIHYMDILAIIMCWRVKSGRVKSLRSKSIKG